MYCYQMKNKKVQFIKHISFINSYKCPIIKACCELNKNNDMLKSCIKRLSDCFLLLVIILNILLLILTDKNMIFAKGLSINWQPRSFKIQRNI